jgi:hypothetical protein
MVVLALPPSVYPKMVPLSPLLGPHLRVVEFQSVKSVTRPFVPPFAGTIAAGLNTPWK